MLNKIDSFYTIKDKLELINQLAKENQNINRYFDDQNLSVEDYKNSSPIGMVSKTILNYIAFIIAGTFCFYILENDIINSKVEYLFEFLLLTVLFKFAIDYLIFNWEIVSTYVSAAVSLILVMSILISEPLVEPIFIAFIAIILLLVSSITVLLLQHIRTSRANTFLKNEKEINCLTKEIETTLTNELIPQLSQENIEVFNIAIIVNQLGLLPKKRFEDAFKSSSNL